MTIYFYENDQATNVVKKRESAYDVGVTLTLSGDLKNDFVITSPVVEIEVSSEVVGGVSEFAKFKRCNYCYIPTFERYYYITNYTIREMHGTTILIAINLNVDVLFSFRDLILEQKVTARETACTSKQLPYAKQNTYATGGEVIVDVYSHSCGFDNEQPTTLLITTS